MIDNPAAPRLRVAISLLCAAGSAWLYQQIVRIVPRIQSAEPTRIGEVFPRIPFITHDRLQMIWRHTHDYWYTGRFIGCCAALFLLYGIMLVLAKGARSGWLAALSAAASAFFMGILALAPAALSSDTYAYSFYGRLLEFYKLDAHSPAPKSTLRDAFLSDGWYQFPPSVYGPLWTVISGGIAWIGGGHVGLTLLLFRLLAIASALGTAGLIWIILRRIAPEQAVFGTIFFIWNPLVITETALGGHNDVNMMFFAVLAVWLHLRGWKAGAVVALALSALVKVITAPLVPLYMLMVLRRSANPREAAAFLARCAIGLAFAFAISVFPARMKLNGVVTRTASSAQFYENNYHELLFKGLRRLLGEPADSIESPMDFQPYWVATATSVALHAGMNGKSQTLCTVKALQPLLAVSDQDSDDWLRLYDPASGLQGYINWPHLTYLAEPPPHANDDPIVRRLSIYPAKRPTVIEANRLIRIGTWSLFVAFGLLAAWKTTDFDSFLLWSNAFFLASQLLVFTKIWPWYAIWPLAYGALKPASAGARLALLFSAGMIIVYVLFDYSNSDRWYWINDYRSIPTIVLPVILFAILQLWNSRFHSNKRLAAEA